MKLVLRWKGGPKSGHHGHAGRPGSVGGSTPGAAGMLVRNEGWATLSQDKRTMLLDDISLVPPSHLEGLVGGIVFGDYEMSALYEPYNRRIKVNPAKITEGQLIHDIGHHVYEKILSKQQRAQVDAEWGTSPSNAGLLSEAHRKWPDETFSELYARYATGVRAEEFVITNNILSSLFGGGVVF